MPSVSITIFNIVLEQWAKGVGADEQHHKVLVLDGAGWHRSPEVVLPTGVHLIFLPPYSPELQPAERLWPLTNEGISNRNFADLDELQTVQSQRCLALREQPAQIAALTQFSWWPLVAA